MQRHRAHLEIVPQETLGSAQRVPALLVHDETDLLDVASGGHLGLLAAMRDLPLLLVPDDLLADSGGQHHRERRQHHTADADAAQQAAGHAEQHHRHEHRRPGRQQHRAEPSAGRREALHRSEIDARNVGGRCADAQLQRTAGVEAEPLADVGGQFGGAFGEGVVVGDRGRDHVATQPDLDVGPGVLRVPGVDDLLDVAQHGAEPALQIVVDIRDEILHTVGEHLLPGRGRRHQAGGAALRGGELRDHLLCLCRLGQHGFLGLNLLPDLLGDEIHVPGSGGRGLRVGGPDHPAAEEIHQTGVPGFRGQRWVTAGAEPQE